MTYFMGAMMNDIYIVGTCTCEGIQDIRSIHRTYNGALAGFKKLCDDIIKQDEEFIDYELINGHSERWINKYHDRIQTLRTYDPDFIEEKLHPSEAPFIMKREIEK